MGRQMDQSQFTLSYGNVQNVPPQILARGASL